MNNGGNLIGLGNAAGSFNAPGDQTLVNDPLLGPLGNNGGFQTGAPSLLQTIETQYPQAGSPAINADLNSIVPIRFIFDQRGEGFPRIVGGTVDAGAVEVPEPFTLLGAGVAALIGGWFKRLKQH